MVSFIVATSGRPSLTSALASIECWPGDEVIVMGQVESKQDGPIRFINCPLGHDWGSKERNRATPLAQGRYLAHLDDDDVYAPNARALMDSAIKETPHLPVLFKMQYPNGSKLWQQRALRFGNVGTPMMLIPNVPAKLGKWREGRIGGDFGFLSTMKWRPSEIVWREEVIALLGHNL